MIRYSKKQKAKRSLSERTQTSINPDEDRTKQEFKEECDINVIWSRYAKNGVFDHVAKSTPQFGDFTNASEYSERLNQVIAAQDGFDNLPALTRRRFGNDPGELLAFMDDPANREEGESLGLFPIEDPPPAPADSPPTPEEKPAEQPPITGGESPPS